MSENKKSYGYAWFVWGLAVSFFFLQYISRISPSVMVPNLMRDFSVNAFSLGSLAACFYYVYAGMQVPVGLLVDQFSIRKLLVMATCVAAIGACIFASAKTLYMAEFGRIVLGFGSAFGFIGGIKLASVWFPASRFGLLAGATQAAGMLGVAIGVTPIALSVSSIGWRYTTLIFVVCFLLLSLLIGIFVRDRPNHMVKERKKMGDSIITLWRSLKIVLSNSQTWINAIYVGAMYAPTTAFGEFWGVSFLRRVYPISEHTAALGISAVFLGWTIGSPLAGWLSDRTGRRRPLMFLSSVCGLITLGLVIFAQLPIYLLFIILFLYGVTNSGVSVSYALSGEINPHKVSGTSVAFANMASILIGTIFQPVIGWLLDLFWKGAMVNGVPFYSAHTMRIAMIGLVACFVVSCVVVFWVKETYCRNVSQVEFN